MENGARVKKSGQNILPAKSVGNIIQCTCANLCLACQPLRFQNLLNNYLKRLRQSVGTAVIDWDLSDFLPNQTFCLYSFPLYLYETSYIP